MGFLEKLERKFGRYAIRNLMMYLTVLYSIGFAISLINIEIYYNYLSLDIPKILSGQVWRILTWTMYAPDQSIFFGAIMLYLYYNLGSNLERVWGSFRFNLYMFMGYFFLIVGAFVLYAIYGDFVSYYPLTPDSLNMSIFLAFAVTYPEMSFVIFYLLTRNWYRISPKSIAGRAKFKKAAKIRPAGESIHKCAVCGRTEKDDDTLEFRFCSKCKGNLEYCSDHLYTHIHVE